MLIESLNRVKTRTMLIVALCAAVLLSLTLAMVVRAQGDDGVLYACASSNSLRLVSGPGECRASEQQVSWNAQGPEGPQGPAGPQGASGATDVNINVSDDSGLTQPVNGFIRFDGVQGEATAEEFAGWSRILAVNHEITNSANFGSGPSGGGAGVVNFAPIKVVKELDTAAPELFQSVASGKNYQSVEIVLVKETDAKSHTYLKYELSDVFIKGHTIGDVGTQSGIPLESLELAFEQITFTYTPQNADGSQGAPISRSWNLLTNSP